MLSDFIKNPIRVARIEAGLNQKELAKLLKVTQGYVSRSESRAFKVTPELLERVKTVIAKLQSRKGHKNK
ncbi:MAG: helix-turn-helix transcriptional regulator [Candidatus Melainabacteria bacterium]|nr:helix-turn-helix transcriptional regulator [Candidatus Melainabacteria bacterium]